MVLEFLLFRLSDASQILADRPGYGELQWNPGLTLSLLRWSKMGAKALMLSNPLQVRQMHQESGSGEAVGRPSSDGMVRKISM